MMRIGVCDDVLYNVERLTESINEWAGLRKLNVQIEKFKRGEEVLIDLEEQGDFVAVFMDVDQDERGGIEAALKLREINRMVSIVFIFQSEEHLKEMFRVYPFQFVEKPILRKKVHEVLDQIVVEQAIFNESFFFRYNRINFNIDLKRVLYFVSERRTIRILMEDGREHIFYEKLDELEEILSGYNHNFVRIHQSYLVNGRQIEQFQYKKIVMRNGDILTISREKWNMICQLNIKLLNEKC